MKKELFVMSLIFLLLIVGAQQGCEREPTGKENPFVGGTDGILIDFVEGAPPPEVFDQGHPFEIVVRLKNKGEADVKKYEGRVDISGISKQDFGGIYTLPFPEDLSGTYKNPEGDVVDGTTTYLTFRTFKHTRALPGNVQFTVRADVCYKYGTKAVTRLCIREEILEYGEEAVCEVDEEKIIYSSGSPIQITGFKQSVGGKNKLSFTFRISHKGVGAIYSPKGKLCETDLAKRNEVRVVVETKMSGIRCDTLRESDVKKGRVEGYVTLYEESASVTCTQPIPSEEAAKAYEKPITINLEFDYKHHIDTPLLVKHAR